MTDLAAAPGALDALSDAELIARVRAGSDAAFSMLYERHLGAARAAARSLGASRADVDDLTSEAFTRVLAALRRGGGPEVAFRPYLMTCVRNAFYDKGRKDGRVDVPGEVPEDVNVALLNVPPDSEDARMVAAAFASLPERWQMVLWHTEVEGRPAAEVGPLLGLAPNAVAALAYRAREGLRQAYLQAHLQLPPPDACRDTVTKLGAYVRDGLSSRDRRRVDEHLKDCERCTTLLLELQEVSTSLRGVLVPILLGVSGTAFVSYIASGGGLAALLRWRPQGPKAQVAVAAAVVGGVVGVAVAVAALTGGGGGEKVEAAAPTASTTAAAAPSTSPPRASTPPSASIVSPPSSVVPVAPVVVVPSTSLPVPAATVVGTTTTAPRVVQTTVRTAPRAATTTTTEPAPTTTTEPAATTTEPAITTTTTSTPALPPPPPPPPLSLGVRAVGPAYAGLGAAVQVSLGQGGTPSETGVLGAAAVVPAATTGPVTITVTGAPVADWDRADCGPGPSCTVPDGTTSVDIRLDLTAVTGAAQIPISVASTADGAAAARADITVAALPRPAGLEYFAVDRGAVAMAANTVVACVPEPGTTCHANNNEEQNLGRVSVGPGAVDSSSADLHLPAGASVRWALLQWGGDPADAPDPARLGDVELTTPDGKAAAVHATSARTASGGAAYTARADVTSIVRALAQPAGTYTVADVQTGEGAGQFGGWSLIVAYRQPDVPPNVIAVFDDPSAPSGVLTRVDHSADVVYSLTGLAAPQQPADVQLGVVAYDGDLGITGDMVKVGAVAAGDPENFFDSSIAVGEAARDPSFPNQYGFDAHLVTVAKALTPADAGPTVTVHVGGGNDGIYLGAVTLVVAL